MAVYCIGLCGFVLLLSLYRYSFKPSLVTFLLSYPGFASVGAAVGILISTSVLARLLCTSSGDGKQAALACISSILVCVFLGMAGEVSLRVLLVQKPDGAYVGHIRLIPYFWQEFVDRARIAWARSNDQGRFILEDDLLGWTIGLSRASDNGEYVSSAEGLRTAYQGEVLRAGLGDCRVALVGDSYTFGEEVSYVNSWAAQLEKLLPKGCRVLNFGVLGYGVDQMYLRYIKDVPSWEPRVVILAFIEGDIHRTMSAYSFLIFPGSDLPFAKPRFHLDPDDRLIIMNLPLVKPDAVMSTRSVADLPFVAYDKRYVQAEWDQPAWKYLYNSVMFRLLISIYPSSERARPAISDNMTRSINRAALRSFVEAVSKRGSMPLVVYLPFPYDYPPYPNYRKDGVRILEDNGIAHLNLTPCLERVPASERFAEHGHYSPAGNVAIAQCLFPVVLEKLNGGPPAVARPDAQEGGSRRESQGD